MKGRKIFHQKKVYLNGDIIEMKIWQVVPVQDKPHGIKYSLVYIEKGKRIIGYDNAERKSDHRHYGGREEPYQFYNIEKLLDDFLKDVANWRNKDED